jgi:hypothetical protein
MKTYIAYFDHLGFKDFIERNDFETQKRGVGNILRDIERAAADGKLKDAPYGVVADLSHTTIQVLNFSDTILFWTQDDSEESLIEILKVAYRYNWGATTFFFPARGALSFGEIQHLDYSDKNEKGGTYHVNSIFGKGLVDVYQKAESSDWSGATIDNSVIEKIVGLGKNPEEFLEPYAKLYDVPYKGGETLNEFAFKLCVEPINEEAFGNVSTRIIENFAEYNKRVDSKGVQRKVKNTIDFLETAKK